MGNKLNFIFLKDKMNFVAEKGRYVHIQQLCTQLACYLTTYTHLKWNVQKKPQVRNNHHGHLYPTEYHEK